MFKIYEPTIPGLPGDAETKSRVLDIAKLMTQEIERTGYLLHRSFAHVIWEMPEFGPSFCCWVTLSGKRGRNYAALRLHPEILKAFKNLTKKRVVCGVSRAGGSE